MLIRLYHKLTNPWLALVFGALAGFLFSRLASGLAALPPGAPSIFDLQLAFTPQRFQFVMEQWGEAAMQNYVTGMWMDYIYPVAYSLALAGFIAWLTVRPNQPPARWHLTLFSLPLIAGLLDWVENTLHLVMLAVLHSTPFVLVFIASLAAAIKWTLAVISILAIFAFAVLRTATFMSQRRNPKSDINVALLSRKDNTMKTLKKILLYLLVFLLVIAIAAPTLGYFGVVRPALPQLDGDLALDGLTAPVTVYRDSSGIPHIVAENAHDLYYAQGFVTAQDRLWSMESQRRAAHGTLSEIVGERGLKNDTFMRILGMTESAEADWETLDAETQSALKAYADGVNAYLAQAGNKLPLEFKILGITPQEWTPIDSLVFGKLVAWGLSNNYQDELVVTKLAAVLSWDETRILLPDYPGPDVIPDANAAALSTTATALLEASADWQSAMPLAKPDQGSNAWVAGGSHTASGLPLLAGDPHQGLSMPTLWYEVGLHTTDGQYDVVGASLPGLPGIEIGHNAHIAWAVTNARPDVQDLFIETINADGTQYQFNNEWKNITVREEIIQVKDGAPITLKARATHHGPIITDATPDSEDTLALRWTGLDEGRPLAQAIIQLNQAANWDEFRAALTFWQLPGMNFVYADIDGNIGFQMSGAVPVRASNDVKGLQPVSGADGSHEWQSFVAFDELPSALNPKGDFFASANNRPAGKDYPHFLSHYFQPPYRVALISETIRDSQNVTAADFGALQASVYSDINFQVARAIAAEATPANKQEKVMLEMLGDWDGMMTPDSGEASLSELALRHILRLTLDPKLGSATTDSYLTLAGYPYMFLQNLLDDPNNTWWDGKRAETMSAALTAAMDELTAIVGSDPAKWTWGNLHTFTFSHPLGSVGALAPIFNRGPYLAGGNWNTVNSGAYYADKAYSMGLGPAYRIIADPADWDASLSIIPSGESGQPFSPYYADQIDSWLAVEYHKLPFTLSAVEASAEHTLKLVP
ncbi:MAG: penicillin acylase family protein [Chloroflexi bacterium]|nr:penicillin acylase family protein [Chloroflexota bacterium]